jgi:hypothetical protein
MRPFKRMIDTIVSFIISFVDASQADGSRKKSSKPDRINTPSPAHIIRLPITRKPYSALEMIRSLTERKNIRSDAYAPPTPRIVPNM